MLPSKHAQERAPWCGDACASRSPMRNLRTLLWLEGVARLPYHESIAEESSHKSCGALGGPDTGWPGNLCRVCACGRGLICGRFWKAACHAASAQ